MAKKKTVETIEPFIFRYGVNKKRQPVEIWINEKGHAYIVENGKANDPDTLCMIFKKFFELIETNEAPDSTDKTGE